VIGDQGMVKRDARTSRSSRYCFGTRSSQRNGLKARWAHRLESLCSNQPRPAHCGTQAFPAVHQTLILARFLPRLGVRAILVFVPGSGAAWHCPTCGDRPIQDYRQRRAADVDHYIAR